MSLISGFSRCTAMSRLRSSANFTASSRVIGTTRRVSGALPGCAVAGVCSRLLGSAACLISARMRASDTCWARAGVARPDRASAAVSIQMDPFHVIASLSIYLTSRDGRW